MKKNGYKMSKNRENFWQKTENFLSPCETISNFFSPPCGEIAIEIRIELRELYFSVSCEDGFLERL